MNGSYMVSKDTNIWDTGEYCYNIIERNTERGLCQEWFYISVQGFCYLNAYYMSKENTIYMSSLYRHVSVNDN